MRGRGTCGSRLSSITCRTIMSQRSSGSPRTSLTEDERLLTPTPPPGVPAERRATFTSTDPWRVLRIMGEFVEGFDTLSDVSNAVSIFGSARTAANDPYYQQALDTARLLAREGFAIITGGGPGVMEAANRGAQEGNGLSIGCNIELPFEQGMNPYVAREGKIATEDLQLFRITDDPREVVRWIVEARERRTRAYQSINP